MESRKATVSITSAGGNASMAAKKHRVTLPNQWAKEIGITEEDRSVIITLDEKRIIIEKAKEYPTSAAEVYWDIKNKTNTVF